MTDPTYRHGTHLLADGGPYSITGRLLGDHDDLDGLVHMLTDDGECLALNGWMFSFEIPRPSLPSANSLQRAGTSAPFRHGRRQRSKTQGAGSERNATQSDASPSTGSQPSVHLQARRSVAFWERPWYKKG